MGLIKAGAGAFGGTMADQWKEFFYCDSISPDVLVVKGEKRVNGRSSNTRGNDNIISNGSGIAVADGQCMIIVEQGKVVEVCAESGEYTFDNSTEPSVFTGKLGDSLKETFKTIGKRFTYGGDTAKDQRVYYINTKEILGNKFGTQTPILFKVLIPELNFSLNTNIRCSGTYTYRITDPIKFYTNIASNVASEYRREEIDDQLKSEMIDALQPAFAELSAMRLDPSEIPAHKNDLKKALNTALSYEWTDRRGISVESIAVANLSIPEEDEERIKKAQSATIYSNPNMAAGMMAEGMTAAMNTAAGNPNGAMNGFVGMGMGMNTMGNGMNAVSNMFAVGQQAQATQQAQASNSWNCSCGAVNQGNFCQNCGKKKPSAVCSNCGWTAENPNNPPKFCPECGNAF